MTYPRTPGDEGFCPDCEHRLIVEDDEITGSDPDDVRHETHRWCEWCGWEGDRPDINDRIRMKQEAGDEA